MSEIQPQCFGLLLAQDRPVTSARLWNNKTEVGRTFLSSLHVSWDPVTLEVHDTMCVTHALLTAGCCRCRGLAWGWPREPKSTLVPSCNLPGLHLTPQEGCWMLLEPSSYRDWTQQGCVSSMLGNGLDWVLMVFPRTLGVASLQWAEFS